MSVNKKNLENRVLETANRLRLVQVDFADKSPKARVDYFCEEIERNLKMILPVERKEFLQMLLERFPTGTFTHQPITQEQENNNISGTIETKFEDVDFLVQCLSEIIPTLPIDRKESIARKLQLTGIGSGTQKACSDESITKLRASLQLDGQSDINVDLLIELIITLTNFMYKLEPLGWNIWRKLAPRSKAFQAGDLKKTIRQFLSNDKNVSQEHVSNELKVLLQLIAALISATSRVGNQFAQHYLARYSPKEIEASIEFEEPQGPLSKILGSSPDQKCWKKYKELADNLTEESIETEIRNDIVSYVESLAKVINRRPQ
jgi:hypothetical protein